MYLFDFYIRTSKFSFAGRGVIARTSGRFSRERRLFREEEKKSSHPRNLSRRGNPRNLSDNSRKLRARVTPLVRASRTSFLARTLISCALSRFLPIPSPSLSFLSDIRRALVHRRAVLLHLHRCSRRIASFRPTQNREYREYYRCKGVKIR